jgi:hypothetical protein
MKLIDRVAWMAGTAYSGVDLILGTTLREVLIVSIKALNEDASLLGYDIIDLDAPEEAYPAEFFHFAWNVTIRPAIALYLMRTHPKAWFLNFYTLDLKPN